MENKEVCIKKIPLDNFMGSPYIEEVDMKLTDEDLNQLL